MMKLQSSLIDGSQKPQRPQGITKNGTEPQPYWASKHSLLLSCLDKRLLDKHLAGDITRSVGGGKYMNIVMPTYLKRHIDATGFGVPLFLMVAVQEFLEMKKEGIPRFYDKLYDIILHRVATDQTMPGYRERAVLFWEHNTWLKWAFNITVKRNFPVLARKRVTMKLQEKRSRTTPIAGDYEGRSLGEWKDEDVDAFNEWVKENWHDLDREQKRDIDPDRLYEEERDDGIYDEDATPEERAEIERNSR